MCDSVLPCAALYDNVLLCVTLCCYRFLCDDICLSMCFVWQCPAMCDYMLLCVEYVFLCVTISFYVFQCDIFKYMLLCVTVSCHVLLLLPKAAFLILTWRFLAHSTHSFAPIYVLARSRSCVCPDVVIPGGGTDGGSARKILNCVHIICKLFSLDLKMQNIRILPEETWLVWLYFFVLISIKAMNCLTFILEASNVLLFIAASYSPKYPIVRMLV
jgi:hypothetical protein